MKLFNSDRPLLVLAPLAGYTDLPFRSVVKRFGADLTVSEMISSNALLYGSEKSLKMVEKSEDEDPYSVQIAGSNLDVVRGAVDVLNGIDGIDIIDLNSGCPAPKVVKSGNGSALLKDLSLLTEVTKTIKEASQKELTSVKVRIGFSEKYGVDIARAVEDGGADFITVHGRTRSGGFKSEVDYDEIARIKEAVDIPVIANGDIDSFEKAQWVLKHTDSDGLMIGRGAVGKPWIFHQILHGSSEVSRELKRDIVYQHFSKMIDFYGERGAILFRKHLHTYSKGIDGASSFREVVNRETDVNQLGKAILEFF